MDALNQSVNKLWSGFSSLGPGKKTAIIGVLAATVALIALLVYLTAQVEYRVLFSNLSNEDAATIVSRLGEKKIPYRISPSGGRFPSRRRRFPSCGWKWPPRDCRRAAASDSRFSTRRRWAPRNSNSS
jgi:hypothetical protein